MMSLDQTCARGPANRSSRRTIFYVVLVGGAVLVAAVLAFAMSGGRLLGTTNSPSADVSGKRLNDQMSAGKGTIRALDNLA